LCETSANVTSPNGKGASILGYGECLLLAFFPVASSHASHAKVVRASQTTAHTHLWRACQFCCLVRDDRILSEKQLKREDKYLDLRSILLVLFALTSYALGASA
jgi:hypothetical protein